MKLKVGRKYKSRHGKVYGPLRPQPDGDNDQFYKFQAQGQDGPVHWGEDGRFWEHLDEHFLDLVEEVK